MIDGLGTMIGFAFILLCLGPLALIVAVAAKNRADKNTGKIEALEQHIIVLKSKLSKRDEAKEEEPWSPSPKEEPVRSESGEHSSPEPPLEAVPSEIALLTQYAEGNETSSGRTTLIMKSSRSERNAPRHTAGTVRLGISFIRKFRWRPNVPLEQLLGVKGALIVGVVSLIVGVGFFLR